MKKLAQSSSFQAVSSQIKTMVVTFMFFWCRERILDRGSALAREDGILVPAQRAKQLHHKCQGEDWTSWRHQHAWLPIKLHHQRWAGWLAWSLELVFRCAKVCHQASSSSRWHPPTRKGDDEKCNWKCQRLKQRIGCAWCSEHSNPPHNRRPHVPPILEECRTSPTGRWKHSRGRRQQWHDCQRVPGHGVDELKLGYGPS